MMQTLHCLRAFVLAAAFIFTAVAAAEPVIDAPPGPVPVGGFCDVTIRGLDNPDALSWATVPEIPVRVYAVWGSGDPILSVPTNRRGTWTLIVAFVEDGRPILHKVPLTIGDGPGPEPEPEPEPDPDPQPEPIPGGFRVLILEETEERQALSRDQLLVLTSPTVRNYLQEKAGDNWRMLDDDIPESGMVGWSQEWKDAYKQAKELSEGKLPFLMVTNGREGTAVPLPPNVDEMMTLLKRYGG